MIINNLFPQQIYDEEGTVSSGTLEELIHELVPRAHSSPSETFQFAFLLSSRLFLTPTRLMVITSFRNSESSSNMTSMTCFLKVLRVKKCSSTKLSYYRDAL